MRAVALKHLAITPAEYWRLTPAELYEALYGAYWREEREWERTAWLTAHLLNISGKSMKRDVTADELLGRPREFRVQDPHVSFAGLWGEIERLRAEGKLPEN